MKKLFLVTLCMSFYFASASSVLGFQSGTGLGDLRDLIGVANANGSSIDLLQVEAARVLRDTNDIDDDGDTQEVIERYYGPNTTNGQFNGKTFQDLGDPSSDGPSQHASGVGFDLYGNSLGVAGGIGDSGSPPISFTSASSFINNDLINGGSTPVVFSHNVSNHSYIVDVDDETSTTENPFFEDDAVEVLRRLDYSINEGNMTTVVGTNNGDSSTELPALFVQAYNTINVGVTSGEHASGLTTLNGVDRTAIHLVTNETTTSGATAIISGLASILHQTGSDITDATTQEVIKASLLAGATKDDFLGEWNNSASHPLDEVFGAGQVNVLNSYLIQQAGEMDGTTADEVTPTLDFNGWDYDAGLDAGEERFYDFLVDSDTLLEELSIALTWNISIDDGSLNPVSFDPEAELANLSLELSDSAGEFSEFSDSSVDNIEHLYFENLSEGTYRLRVFNGSSEDISTDFGLAFRSNVVSAVPEPYSSSLLIGFSILCLAHRRRKLI